VEETFGDRWRRAVDATAGEVLVHDGEPALARYFSTSGGATRNNEDVFPSSGAFPYLRGVEDPDDAISPFHEWRVVFEREDFDALLARGETLSAATPVAAVEVVPVAEGRPNRVVVTGADGTVAEVTAGQLQSFLNTLAPEVHPELYPGPRRDGGRLPSTVPTTRYTVEVTEDDVVLDGRGWGHAVGLGQYGARGKAERGMTHEEILAAYYNGLRPVTTSATPDRIRVGLADDVDELAIRAEGPVTVRAGDTVLTERGFGEWRVAAAADGTIGLVAPPGTGAPLVAATTTTTRTRPFPTEVVTVETVVNRPAELVVEVRSGEELVATRSIGVLDRGRHATGVALPTVVDGAPLAPGTYAVALVAVDEDGSRAGAPASIELLPVQAGTMASVLAGRDPLPPPSGAPPVLPALLGLGVGAAAGVTVRRRVEVPS
jgi:SpoIID/LytB domain protein